MRRRRKGEKEREREGDRERKGGKKNDRATSENLGSRKKNKVLDVVFLPLSSHSSSVVIEHCKKKIELHPVSNISSSAATRMIRKKMCVFFKFVFFF